MLDNSHELFILPVVLFLFPFGLRAAENNALWQLRGDL